MKKPSGLKGKLPLLFSTFVALSAVFTASVSTFAWFQAQASIEIGTTSSGTTITVSKPDDFELNNPKTYVYKGNGTKGYSGSIGDTGSDGTITIDDDFTDISDYGSAAKTAALTTANLWPGYKMTIAYSIEVGENSDTDTISSSTLTLKSYLPGIDNNRIILNGNATAETSYKIAIAQAINLYGAINKTGIYAETSSDFNYSPGDSVEDVEIATSSDLDSNIVYYFLTIEFSNSSDTWYEEHTKETGPTYPVAKETQTSEIRYFKPSPTGNSSCYEGLSFTISEMRIEVE